MERQVHRRGRKVLQYPFLDVGISQKDDGGVKGKELRKVIHTDEYLRFHSHHPLTRKRVVIQTLYNWCDNIIMEEVDTAAEIIHVDKAKGRCGYPKSSFMRVRESMDKRKQEGWMKKKEDSEGTLRPL